MWTFSESETGSEEDVVAYKNSCREPPMHPVNQTAREAQKLKGQNGHTMLKCLQPQFITKKKCSRSLRGCTDENMTNLWMIWTWIWLFRAYFWIPVFEQQFILGQDHDANLHYLNNHLLAQCGTVIPWNWKTDLWTKRNHWFEHDKYQKMLRGCRQAYCAAELIGSPTPKPASSSTQCVGKMGDDPTYCDLHSENNHFKDMNRIDGMPTEF